MTYKGWYAIKPNQPTNQPTLGHPLYYFTYLCRRPKPRESDKIDIFKNWKIALVDNRSFVYKKSGLLLANILDYEIKVSEFELQSRYYVPFQTHTMRKGIKSRIPQLWVK